MTILLTSCGLSNQTLLDWTADQVRLRQPERVTIITTAARLKEQNEWAQVTRQQLLDMGVPKVNFFDFEQQDISELAADTFIYVNGGNTFRLMHGMAQQNMRGYLDGFFARGGLYIGVSAGSAVMGSHIDFLSRIGMDPDEHDWSNKPALGYYKGPILPHAGPQWSPPMAALQEANVLEIEDGPAFILNPTTGQITQRL